MEWSPVAVRIDVPVVRGRRRHVRRVLSALATMMLTTALAAAAHAGNVSTCSPEYRLGKSAEDSVWPGCLQLSYDFNDMAFTRDYCIVSDAPSWATDDYRISTGAGAQWVCPSAKPGVR